MAVRLPPAFFCSQDCFKRDWTNHNKLHKAKKSFTPFAFDYTGPLRPDFVTPMRTVPDHILKPDYAVSGVSVGEQRARAQAQIPIYDAKQIKGIRAACKIGREILDMAGQMVRPGITTEEIDRAVHEAIIERGAYPSPLNYNNFPKSCCTSVNEVICHGIPDCRELCDGDIVNIDITVYYKGYHGDLNETFLVGKVADKYKKFIKTTYDSLMKAIELVKPGTAIREFGNAISAVVARQGYSVVRTYVGHGIGELFHCAPNIPHYARNKAVGVLRPGMVFTIEPMINHGTWRDKLWPDDWTSVTADGERSAQFEHTLLVTNNGVEVLTARTKVSPPFFWEVESSSSLGDSGHQAGLVAPLESSNGGDDEKDE